MNEIGLSDNEMQYASDEKTKMDYHSGGNQLDNQT